MAIKNELSKLDKKALIEIISDLSKKNKAVKEYLDFYFKPDEDGLFETYKTKVYEAFFPKRGFGYNLKQAKQHISDFKKLSPSPQAIAQLMFVYVETGVAFTNQYGDIGETFYNSLVNTFAGALKLIRKENLLDQFEKHAAQIITDACDIGWGFPDALSYIFESYY